jgi:hypothetical protein
VNFSRISAGVLAAVLLAVAAAAAGLAQTAPPAANGVSASPVPVPSPSGRPRRGRRAGPAPGSSPNATPTDTPEPPQYTTLEGSWEIELQPQFQRLADYSFMTIRVNGSNLTGAWVHGAKHTSSPMIGTFDGHLISMTVTLPDGSAANFAGYVEDFDNMVGMYRTSDRDPGTAFTGQHRKKERT